MFAERVPRRPAPASRVEVARLPSGGQALREAIYIYIYICTHMYVYIYIYI